MYRYYNANPNNDNILDCTVRSLSTVTGMSWRQAYRELSRQGEKLGLMMDSVASVEYYLDGKYRRVCFDERMTVGEFAKKHTRGRYLVTMNNHISSVINGVIIDTWDCSNKLLKCAWKVK